MKKVTFGSVYHILSTRKHFQKLTVYKCDTDYGKGDDIIRTV